MQMFIKQLQHLESTYTIPYPIPIHFGDFVDFFNQTPLTKNLHFKMQSNDVSVVPLMSSVHVILTKT